MGLDENGTQQIIMRKLIWNRQIDKIKFNILNNLNEK